MGDPDLEQLRLKALEVDVPAMAEDFGTFADRLEASGAETPEDLQAFVEEYPQLAERVADNLRTLFGDRDGSF